MKCVVTHTDTFGGEANYGWVKRYEFVPKRQSQRSITYHAKKAAGMTGVKSDTYDYGDGLTIRPRGYAQVIFVDFEQTARKPMSDKDLGRAGAAPTNVTPYLL